jgi:hypothetical protein
MLLMRSQYTKLLIGAFKDFLKYCNNEDVKDET